MSAKVFAAVLTMILGANGPNDLVPVIVASRPLPAGTVVTLDVLEVRAIPRKIVTSSLVKPDSASYIVGQRIVEDFDTGVPLRWSAFASSSSEEEGLRCARMTEADSPPVELEGITPNEGASVRVLVAKKEIMTDDIFDPTAFSSLEIPLEYASSQLVRARDADKLKGQRILVQIQTGEPLHVTQLAGKSEPKRCRILFEELGNRFVLGAPSDEAKVVACPKGTVVRSGIPDAFAEGKKLKIGWIRFCQKPSGVRHGLFAAWNRRGFLQLKGRLVGGLREGQWEVLDEKGAVTASAEFRKGLRQGRYESGRGASRTRGQFRANVKQGKWRLGDGGEGSATGRFDGGRFAGTWTFESRGEAHQLVFENGRPKKPDFANERPVAIAVLARDLKAGERVGREDVASVALPAWAASPLFVTEASSSRVVAAAAPFDLRAGSPLVWDDFELPWRFDVTKAGLEKGTDGAPRTSGAKR